MSSETVRIKPETHAKLKFLAESSGESMPQTLERAIESLRRQMFLEQANVAYGKLRKDKKAWTKFQAEQRLWNRTLADGLKDTK